MLDRGHLEMLTVGSGIPATVIDGRGYYSVSDPAELLKLGFSEDQAACAPTLIIPIRDVASGEVVGHQSRPDFPRLNDRNKTVKYETPPRWQMRLDCHPDPALRAKLGDPKVDLWITEGVKKGDAAWARGLCCIALIGVWNWRGTNDVGGSTALADWESIALKGRTIYIAFDNDVMVKPSVVKAMRRLAAFLKKRGAKRVIPIVPAIRGIDGKLGLDDYFVAGGRVFELQQCANFELLGSSKPRVLTNGRQGDEIHEDALAALVSANDPPSVFVRGGELVRMVEGERIVALAYGGIRNRLTACAEFFQSVPKKDGPDEKVIPHCPRDVAEHFLSEMEWPGIPELLAVANCPMVSADGHISERFGYDPRSKYFISSSDEWPLWAGDARSAADFLLHDVLVDFPFRDAASRAHALALMFLPMVRPTIDAATPLHLIDAPSQSSGKSLLAKSLLRITQGPNIHAAPAPEDEAEWRKTIMSKLRDGRPYIFIDDVSGLIKSPALNGVLTSTNWSDRQMQLMQEIYCPNRAAWVITCNNANLSTDLAERSVWIRIDAGVADPAKRSVFRHPDIETWVIDNRPRIISAMLRMVRHWLNEKPIYAGAVHGRYPVWTRVIGGMLQSCGVDGFMSNFEEMRASTDSEMVSVTQFVTRWWELNGDMPVKASDLLSLWDADDYLAGRLRGVTADARKQSLGYKLQGLRDRTFACADPVGGFVQLAVIKLPHYQGSVSYKLTQKAVFPVEIPGVLAQPPKTPTGSNIETPTGSTVGVGGGLGGFSYNPPDARAHARAHDSDLLETPQSPTNPHENEEMIIE